MTHRCECQHCEDVYADIEKYLGDNEKYYSDNGLTTENPLGYLRQIGDVPKKR